MQQDDLRAEWGRRLTRAREALGLSIGDLARRTGIHKSQLARFERGEAGLGDEARIKVAAAIGQQVASLFPYPTIPTTETDCRSAECATAEAGSPRLATLLKEIPQDGRMDERTRAQAAESAKKAHYQRMALKSVQARRRKRAAQEED